VTGDYRFAEHILPPCVLSKVARLRASPSRSRPPAQRLCVDARLVHVLAHALPRGLRGSLPVRVHRLLAPNRGHWVSAQPVSGLRLQGRDVPLPAILKHGPDPSAGSSTAFTKHPINARLMGTSRWRTH
jgi:hypothetical protein